ncbi:MAG: MmcQ/YjbR family DNA-binding protein [Planctomycetota bacterium]
MKFTTIRRYALSLPQVTEQPHFDLTSFRVRGKIFMTAPPQLDHLHLFVAEEIREEALNFHSDCSEELLWGSKVVGLRVRLDKVPANVAKRLVRLAWENKAPAASKPKSPTPPSGSTPRSRPTARPRRDR